MTPSIVAATALGGATTWSRITTAPAELDNLTDIQCMTPTECLLTGQDIDYRAIIARTADAGVTWTTVFHAETFITIRDLGCISVLRCIAMVTPSTPPNAYLITVDAGNSWSTRAAPTGVDTLETTSCAEGFICMATGRREMEELLFTSTDGESWEVANKPLPLVDEISGVACSRMTCWIAKDGTSGPFVARSDDGLVWVERTPPHATRLPASLYCIDGEECWLPGTRSIEHTTDGGTTWIEQPLENGIYGVDSLDCTSRIQCFAVTSLGERAVLRLDHDRWISDANLGGSGGLLDIDCSGQLCIAIGERGVFVGETP